MSELVQSLILSVVVFVLLYIYVNYIVNPSPLDQMIKWLMYVIGGILAIVAIANIWGLSL